MVKQKSGYPYNNNVKNFILLKLSNSLSYLNYEYIRDRSSIVVPTYLQDSNIECWTFKNKSRFRLKERANSQRS